MAQNGFSPPALAASPMVGELVYLLVKSELIALDEQPASKAQRRIMRIM